MDIRVFDTAADAAHRLAALVTEELASIDGPSTFGLAGGSTPRIAYELFGSLEIDWGQVTCWLGDERWVDPGHEHSNVAMVRETFVDSTSARLVAPEYGDHGPESAAAGYEQAMSGLWVDRGDGARPDLVLLGMGSDGHTASLFPGTSALDIDDRDFGAVFVAEKDMWRITATFPLLARARHIVFVVTGDSKAAMVNRVIRDGEALPAAIVSQSAARVTWMLDQAAASDLTPSPR